MSKIATKSIIELYYNKEKDILQMVQDGILKFHDEGVNSIEFFSYFGPNIENQEDLKDAAIQDIVMGYETLLADFNYNCGLSEVKSYFDNVKKHIILGELILIGEIDC